MTVRITGSEEEIKHLIYVLQTSKRIKQTHHGAVYNAGRLKRFGSHKCTCMFQVVEQKKKKKEVVR